MSNIETLNRAFLQQIATCNVRGIGERSLPERILRAVETTPRHEFIDNFRLNGDPFVYAPGDAHYFEKIYSAVPLIYDGYRGTTNSDPSFILHLVDLLGIQPGDRVLEIGSGTGWLSAIMARLAGSVTGIEISEELVLKALAAKSRLGIDNVSYEAGSVLGKKISGPFQRIIFTASTFALPETVFNALEIGGVLGLPIRQRGLSDGFYFLRKEDANTARSFVSRLCKFVPIQGETGDNTGVYAFPAAARQLFKEPPSAQAPLTLLEDPQSFFLLAPLESFLSKMEPERFAVFNLSPEAEARSISWRLGTHIDYAFGFCDGEILSLWQNNEVRSYGPNVQSLQKEFLSACAQWQRRRRPSDIDCELEIVRRQEPASGQFEEQRGAFVYRWHYRS